MNTLGKIFIFAVMVMSVVFMSFAIAIFSSHTNWQKESQRLATELEQAKAERQAKESELTTLNEQIAASEKDREQVVAKLETALQQKDTELAGLKKKREAELSDLDKDIKELASAKDERDAAEKLVGELREEIHGLQDNLMGSVNRGAELAAEHSAISADHLEYTSEDGVKAMARSGTAAVLLPGSFYYLKEKQIPPIDSFRKYGVPLVLATDANPGSSPVFSILSAINMGCVLFGMAPEEAFVGVTRNAAAALGLQSEIGTLEVGKIADMAVWELEHPRELAYWVGVNPCREVIVGGDRIHLSVTDRWTLDGQKG